MACSREMSNYGDSAIISLQFLIEVIQRWMNWIDTLSIQQIINPNDQF